MRYRWYTKDTRKLVIEVVRSMDDRDVPPTLEELLEEDISGVDPLELTRVLEVPTHCKRHIPQTGRSRYVADGGVRDLLEANKLQHEANDMHEDDRHSIEAEIDKLKGGD